jgi:hypothetical protein
VLGFRNRCVGGIVRDTQAQEGQQRYNKDNRMLNTAVCCSIRLSNDPAGLRETLRGIEVMRGCLELLHSQDSARPRYA